MIFSGTASSSSKTTLLHTLLVFCTSIPIVQAVLSVTVGDADSYKKAASTAAYDMMTYYTGNETGQIPGKLFNTWWEGGAMFMTLIEYWHWTGDGTYNAETIQGMQWQAGNADYMPLNYSNYLGNDDQMFWGLAAITGAEFNFPNSPNGFSWLELAQGVFNTQVGRWDTTTCNGGMRWQMWQWENGYYTKNAIANGGLFQLAARLARYTNNQTYAHWAEKIWDWSATTPLLDTQDWHIADSTSMPSNCTDHGDIQWSYNYGTYLMGAVYMYNYTNAGTKWQQGIDGLLNSSYRYFFPTKYGGNVMSETACETVETCDRNQICYKGLVATWMALTTILAPYTTDQILPKLQASAAAAAKQCSGGSDGDHCGIKWYDPTWDGTSGLEQQMATTALFSANLVAFAYTNQSANNNKTVAPLTAQDGGNSTSNPNAGLTDSQGTGSNQIIIIKTADKIGAGIVTAAFGCAWLGIIGWLLRAP